MLWHFDRIKERNTWLKIYQTSWWMWNCLRTNFAWNTTFIGVTNRREGNYIRNETRKSTSIHLGDLLYIRLYSWWIRVSMKQWEGHYIKWEVSQLSVSCKVKWSVCETNLHLNQTSFIVGILVISLLLNQMRTRVVAQKVTSIYKGNWCFQKKQCEYILKGFKKVQDNMKRIMISH